MQRIYTFRDEVGTQPIEVAVVPGGGRDLYRAAERETKKAAKSLHPVFMQFERDGEKSQIFDVSDVNSLMYLKLRLV